MKLELIKPIDISKEKQPQIYEAVAQLKKMKSISITQEICKYTGVNHSYETIQERITHNLYETTNHIFYFDGIPILKFTPLKVEVTATKIICNLEYILLYRKVGE